MPSNVVQKILSGHVVAGEAIAGAEVGVRIDQTLTEDATGTTAFLRFEAMVLPRVNTELSVSYVDHNLAQYGPENQTDHRYLQSISPKVGVYHSRPGNGICHQVHLERFAAPGKTLLGSDSHTPTAGGMGMLAIGAGGLDVAVAMGGGAFYMTCPRVIGVELTGELPPWVSSKDIILRLLSILTTKGNVGCAVEYFGAGVATLSVPQRATCTNMGAELGVTSSVFPADEATKRFLEAQQRGGQFTELRADDGATYDRITKKHHAETDAGVIENIRMYCKDVEVSAPDKSGMVEVSFSGVLIDLGALEPLAAAPSSPGNVRTVASLVGQEVNQVIIGSCTNSSYEDLTMAADVLGGRTVHPNVELGIAPGSRQVLNMLAEHGSMGRFVLAGARILETGCGPCIGLGFSPAEDVISLRTFNRNFPARSGTKGDKVYLVSVETALAAALTGEITDPRKLTEQMGIEYPRVEIPERFSIDDGMIIPPLSESDSAGAKIVRGSTIVTPPRGAPLPGTIAGEVLIKLGDKISTDAISPAGALLKHRSNVPVYAKYAFEQFNAEGEPTFAERALALKSEGKGGVIVAGASYGQGSSREHAALCPMYLGVQVVIAVSIERIHQANLVNFGILPLTFAAAEDCTRIDAGDELVIEDVTRVIESGESVIICNVSKGFDFVCNVALAGRQRKILAAGGLLNYTRENTS
ncbi:MAG: aconitate hydratase [Planctomycetota bacterium]|jgi:aconitate hydratase